ncbi:MAG: hypothetical protein IID40_01590 [Planctomycetes bacterium]|nr:hypothetical protein [Planctomycetota bacterium]
MNERRAKPIMAGLACLMLGPMGGCTPSGQPDENELLFYFRAVPIQGHVRRVWPDGQNYVDQVLKANAALRGEIDKLDEYAAVDSLWLTQDPRWRDQDQLLSRLDALNEAIDGRRPTRLRLHRELGEAIAAIPDALNTDPSAFAAAVFDALDLPASADELAPYERAAAGHRELCEAVRAAAAGFDSAGAGLKFADAARQQRIDQLHGALSGLLESDRDAFIAQAAQDLTRTLQRLGTVDNRERRHEYQYLTDRKKYLRKVLGAIPKGLFEAIKRHRTDREEARKQRDRAEPAEQGKLDAQITFIETSIEHLEAQRSELKPRIDALIEKTAEPE